MCSAAAFVHTLSQPRHVPAMKRTSEQERLDIEVATGLFGFRWVQWNERALGGSPLYAPGRFIAPPDDAMAHLFEEAGEGSPLHDHAVAKVPEYSGDETCAFRAAERARLFIDGNAILFREGDGQWVIEVRGLKMRSPRLPMLLCRASLRWSAVVSGGGR